MINEIPESLESLVTAKVLTNNDINKFEIIFSKYFPEYFQEDPDEID